MTIPELIARAGGRQTLADRLGSTPKAIYMWTRKGVPHKHHAQLRAMLRRRIAPGVLAQALEWRPGK